MPKCKLNNYIFFLFESGQPAAVAVLWEWGYLNQINSKGSLTD